MPSVNPFQFFLPVTVVHAGLYVVEVSVVMPETFKVPAITTSPLELTENFVTALLNTSSAGVAAAGATTTTLTFSLSLILVVPVAESITSSPALVEIVWPVAIPTVIFPSVLLVSVSVPASVAKSAPVSAVLNSASVPVMLFDPKAIVLLVRVSVPASVASVPVTEGRAIEVAPAIAGA